MAAFPPTVAMVPAKALAPAAAAPLPVMAPRVVTRPLPAAAITGIVRPPVTATRVAVAAVRPNTLAFFRAPALQLAFLLREEAEEEFLWTSSCDEKRLKL